MLSPNAMVREAKIVARRLIKQKAWLECHPNRIANPLPGTILRQTSREQSRQWIVVSDKTRHKEKITPLPAGLVDAMLSENWLIADPTGALRLSTVGAEKLVKSGIGNDFAAQHQQRQPRLVKNEQGISVPVIVNDTESPLGWMRARKDKSGQPLLSREQFEAGERVRRDFTLAQMSARVTASWEFTSPASQKGAGRGDGAMEISERALAAKQRFFAALDYLGPEMSGVVYEVCCMASGLEAAERQFGWPRRSAKLVLQIALAKLSQHYGFVQPPPKLPRSAPIRHWGSDNYRPHIPPAAEAT